MDQEVKAKWLEALESGKYKPTRNALRREDGPVSFKYCCLGVLGDVVDPNGWTNSYIGCWSHRGRVNYLADDFAESFGLTQDEQDQLAKLNDEAHPADFQNVIPYIRDHL